MSTATINLSDEEWVKYLLAKAERRDADWGAFERAHAQLQEQMAAAGITEEDIIADLDRIHAERKARRKDPA